jgi:uroporphyrinogen-III synthase
MIRQIKSATHKGIDTKTWARFVIMVWICTVAAFVQGEQRGKMNPEMPLPAEAAGWTWDGKEMKYTPKTLFEYMNGAAELYLAYGFQGLRVRKFEKSNQPSITVELYEMASSEDAYGLFSFERQDEAVGIGQGSEFGGGLLRFWKGKYFVGMYADGGGVDVESAILTMGRATADLIQGMGLEPELVGLIPGTDLGLVDRSVRYLKSHILLNQRFFIAHQNILNLSRTTEAVLAQYTREKQKTHLLLIRYPGVKEATDAYQSFMGAYLPDAGAKDLIKTEDRKWTMARQKGEVVIVVFGSPTAADAEALLKATEEKLRRGRQQENKE